MKKEIVALDSVLTLYLVRHAQSEANRSNLWQFEVGPLTDEGKKQAHALGERFRSISFDAILTSDFERAKETADIIAADIGWEKGVITTPLFGERRRPSEMRGQQKENLEIKKIELSAKEHYEKNEHDWKYSDEESFNELVERARQAAHFCLTQKQQTLLVVTHGTFMRLFVCFLIFGDDFSPRVFQKTVERWRTTNGGITLLRRFPDRGSGVLDGWSLSVWNDRAHLG